MVRHYFRPYVGSLGDGQTAIFESHLPYVVSSKTAGVAQQLASIELLVRVA